MAFPLAAIPLITSGVKAVGGLIQTAKAKKMERGLKRTPMTTPKPFKEAMAMLSARTMGGMPGAGQMRSDIGGATSQALSAQRELSNSPAAAMGGSAMVAANQMGALNRLGIQESQYKDQAMQDLIQAKMGPATQLEKEKFDYNVAQPFQQSAMAIQDLKQKGAANIFGGIQEAGGNLMNMQMMKKYGMQPGGYGNYGGGQ